MTKNKQVTSFGIGKRVADRLTFDRDLAGDVEVRQLEDRDALVAAICDIEVLSVGAHSHRDELFCRCNLRRIEDHPLLDCAACRIDRHDSLGLRKANVNRAVGADRDAMRIAWKRPAANDLRVVCWDDRERSLRLKGDRGG